MQISRMYEFRPSFVALLEDRGMSKDDVEPTVCWVQRKSQYAERSVFSNTIGRAEFIPCDLTHAVVHFLQDRQRRPDAVEGYDNSSTVSLHHGEIVLDAPASQTFVDDDRRYV